MSGIWSFLGSKKNREILAWLAGGLAAVVVALWTAFVYFHPPRSDGGEGKGAVSASHGGVSVGGNVTNSTINTSPELGKVICAQQGSIAAGHDASGNIINYNGSALTGPGGQPASCGDLTKPR